MTNEKFLSASELADRWSGAVTKGTLANWRSNNKGPAFVKVGSRVRYPLDQVVAYEAVNLRGVNDNEPKNENDKT